MSQPQDELQAVSNFIKQHPVGVLATASKQGEPHAAAVYFVSDDSRCIYFLTKEDTQKHRNLQENPRAAVTIYDAQTLETLQIEAKAEVLPDVSQFLDLYNRILKASSRTTTSERPPVSKLNAGDYFMYKLIPSSLRLADYSKPDHGDLDIFRSL